MTNNNKKEIASSSKFIKIKNTDECNVSKASSEIMLDRISVNDQKEFPFLNSL
tara:strand:- start:6 stop:164 length:159 start_codon:yes stop_codon:yes gene_type:complete